ncbi:heme oxygenase-like protein [Aspergillus campestris IBT 28561]|uniref:Heme oxygenase-like protein n=1 Tax=Aspergillus campestris (strain IBT 28561) TaxID=1392248 RepID=A0A2I1DEL9_ASPC2|nr:heme oxygenase-like protein [Aspergillus campestris IBT 28561]PKY08333.1 heme oxygenase-like protein [Aspergillus campestris IBT 28561]
MTLTTHLLTTHPPTPKAIAHPFLTSAGKGTIPTHLLSAWLAQDRLYAQTYIRFIGHLLSKVDLPVLPPSQKEAGNKKQTQKETKTEAHQKAASTLSACLANILTELSFFDSVADEYGLDLTPYTSFPSPSSSSTEGTTTTTNNEERKKGPNPTTQSYTDLFIASSASPTASLLEGLVVLYATEFCYLRAWRHAASILSERLRGSNADGGEDADGGALRRLIPNWASVEFEVFVRGIGEVVDFVAEAEGLSSLGEGEGGQGGGGDVDDMLGRCEKWWRQVVWLEERFWPDVE